MNPENTYSIFEPHFPNPLTIDSAVINQPSSINSSPSVQLGFLVHEFEIPGIFVQN